MFFSRRRYKKILSFELGILNYSRLRLQNAQSVQFKNSKLKTQNSKFLILRSRHSFLHVRLYFGVLVVGVDCHSEDASCVNQAFGEQSQHAFVNLAQRRYDEASHRKRHSERQHSERRAHLKVLSCFLFHGKVFFMVVRLV